MNRSEIIRRVKYAVHVAAAAWFAGCVALVAACGGGGGDSSPAGSPSASVLEFGPLEIANPGEWINGATPFWAIRPQVSCGGTGNTAVIVVVGQSLSVNNVNAIYTP